MRPQNMADNIAIAEQVSSAASTPSKPRIVNSNIFTIDITTKFRNAASKLEAGSLVKDEYFTLFESVGALEIGDAKMDSGCVEDGELLEDDYDVCQPLLSTDLIWLMDELLSRELGIPVAWHMGYPLSQTLFTSVYIEKLLWPDPTQLHEASFSRSTEIQDSDPMLHKLFRSYCLGLVKSCDLVLGMVTSQHYYEEEDFATQLYNRELLHRFSVDDVLADMEKAMQYLHDMLVDASIKEGLEARMTFRLMLLTMLSSHAKGNISPESTFQHDPNLIQRIQDSRHLGTPQPDSFTLKIQRRLASTVPPRPMVTIDEVRTFNYLKHFVQNCQNVSSVLRASHSQDLLTTYSTFNSQDPQPSVYVRALMQFWLNKDNLVGGILNEVDFIARDMEVITMAASPISYALETNPGMLTSNLKLSRQHVSDFIAKHGRSFLNIWRTMCLNRCRVRRTLCHAAIEWDQIQAEAEELDDELQRLINEPAVTYPAGGVPTYSYMLSSWVYHCKLNQLRLIVQTGFELDIYAPHELASMYWYLGHLCDTHLSHLERISYFTAQREAVLPPAFQRSTQEANEARDCRASLRHLYRHFSWLKATEATAKALHGLYTVLQRNGQFQEPATTYASDSLRYELRMRPFLYLSIPEPFSFEQCRRRYQMEVRNDHEILEESASYIAIAKKSWEEVLKAKWNAFPLKQDFNQTSADVIDRLWTMDVRSAVKASISLGIAVITMRKYTDTIKPGLTPSLKATIPQQGEKDYWHPWWIVPRIAV